MLSKCACIHYIYYQNHCRIILGKRGILFALKVELVHRTFASRYHSSPLPICTCQLLKSWGNKYGIFRTDKLYVFTMIEFLANHLGIRPTWWIRALLCGSKTLLTTILNFHYTFLYSQQQNLWVIPCDLPKHLGTLLDHFPLLWHVASKLPSNT